MRIPLCVFVLILSLAPRAWADLILPGFRRISHQLVIEPSAAWQGQRIVALPVRGFGGSTEVAPGVPFEFSSKYRTRLYVVSATEEIPRVVDEAWRASHVSADIPVTEISAVPVASPVESASSTLRIEALDGERFELALVDTDERYDPWGIVLMIGALVLGVLGLVYLRRRRLGKARAS